MEIIIICSIFCKLGVCARFDLVQFLHNDCKNLIIKKLSMFLYRKKNMTHSTGLTTRLDTIDIIY